MLNARQKKFAEYYAQSGNAEQAAVKAGYSEKYARGNAHKIVANSGVAEYIRELTEKAKDERILTAKDRQVMLSDIAKDGENEAADRIRAIDTLNKMTGEYLSRVEVNGSLTAQTEKLDELVKQMRSDE